MAVAGTKEKAIIAAEAGVEAGSAARTLISDGAVEKTAASADDAVGMKTGLVERAVDGGAAVVQQQHLMQASQTY
jgi:hypothetical protein